MNSFPLDFPTLSDLKKNLDTELIGDFETYYEESLFGLTLIEEDLIKLPSGSRILEIGSGIGLISVYLASLGFEVVSLEPAGEGFGMMQKLQKHTNNYFKNTEYRLDLEECTFEEFKATNRFKYIFSINVFEHLDSPYQAIEKVISLLDENGVSRIIAPNYSIPYEPHFNIPIIFNKKITYRVFKNYINTFVCYDPQGLWKSLNWIKISRIRKLFSVNDAPFAFSKSATRQYFNRLDRDMGFQKRKGILFILLAKTLRRVIPLLPTNRNPIIDLKIGPLKTKKL